MHTVFLLLFLWLLLLLYLLLAFCCVCYSSLWIIDWLVKYLWSHCISETYSLLCVPISFEPYRRCESVHCHHFKHLSTFIDGTKQWSIDALFSSLVLPPFLNHSATLPLALSLSITTLYYYNIFSQIIEHEWDIHIVARFACAVTAFFCHCNAFNYLLVICPNQIAIEIKQIQSNILW